MNNPPVEKIYNLSDLSAAGAEIAITAKADELPGLAQWLDVSAVTRFEGTVTLRRLSQTRFAYEGKLVADVVQACVVTLEPVRARIKKQFSRTLHLTTGPAAMRETVIVSPDDDDSPEEIASTRYDLAGPLLEELLLSIDPYPRAAGVAFEPLAGETAREASPFAVLKQLKQGS
ncbi:MAG TPA: DUF177 domain-containing protein [Rhizomicrobium sp.]|jgi:uncharacterized metal-binding protein YceD (DUF177 family)|nr:DUF177 domain-containing protein [Rhizomicrobium sp.]